jgi:hypothetical protein
MASEENHEHQDLASRLVAAADGIVNHAAGGLERDLRDAAEIIRDSNRPVALIPRLVSDLAKIANTTSDDDTRRKLRRLLGEAQQ